jgi:hypothetical protein
MLHHHHPLETRYDSQLLWMNHNPKPYEPWMTQVTKVSPWLPIL